MLTDRGYVVEYSRTCKFTGKITYQHGEKFFHTREEAEQAAAGSSWSYEIIEVRTVCEDAATLQQARAA